MTTSPRGHLFVVRGRIGEMVADAQVLPTDLDFNVEDYWWSVIGAGSQADLPAHRPPRWSRRGWGKDPVAPVWFLDVTATKVARLDQFGRLMAVLHHIELSGIQPGAGRVNPLVILPVIGTKGGGMSGRRGEVIARLLNTCRAFTDSANMDVAIVTTNASTYAALQSARRSQQARFLGTDDDLDVARPLAERVRDGSLSLFIGAGTSIPAGAPSWRSLIERLAEKAGVKTNGGSGFDMLTALDQAQLIQQNLESLACDRRSGSAQTLGSLVSRELEACTRPALAHLLLAALECPSAVTTNYDRLYESAVEQAGSAAVSVLPAELPMAGTRWILKMHGDVASPESIVLTRGQFVGFEAASGPSGAVLQSLLLTKHLLVVGTSFADDNVLRLIHEVAAFRRPYRSAHIREEFGTVLDVGDNAARAALHSEYFDWHRLPGADLGHRARSLEVLLDVVAALAADDHSWLLDPEYADLLDSGSGASLADRVRALAFEIEAQPGASWDALSMRLRDFGVPDAPWRH